MRRVYLVQVVRVLLLMHTTAFAQTRFEGRGEHTLVESIGFFRGSPLMDAFYFRFGPPLGQSSSEDHHIQIILVKPQDPSASQLTVSYSNDGQDETYSYIVPFHQRRGGTRAQLADVGCAKTCVRELRRPRPDDIFVIVGFQVFFTGDDHHLERVAVLENDGTVTIAFHDDGRRTFRYALDYVYLPRTLIRDLGVRPEDA